MFSGSQITRLGLGAFARGLYGSFAGKAEQVIVEEEAKGGGKRRSRYPRRIVVEGQVIWVRSPEEERQLLIALLERAEARKEQAQEQDQEAEANVERRRMVRFKHRLERLQEREAAWNQRLQEIDQELIILLN